MKRQKPNKKIQENKILNFDFLLELTDDELDKLARGETLLNNSLNSFCQSF